MSQATFSIRMDEALKKDFDLLCTDFGMSATTAFNVFARAVVRERKIPFEITSLSTGETREIPNPNPFNALRMQAKENGIQDLSLEQINDEIAAARQARSKS